MRYFLVFCMIFSSVSHAQALRKIEFLPASIPTSGHIVIPVMSAGKLKATGLSVDKLSNNALSRAIAETEFKGEPGDRLTLLQVVPYSRIDLIGIGNKSLSQPGLEDFGGNTAIAQLERRTTGNIQIMTGDLPTQLAPVGAHVAFGFHLGDYYFSKYQQEKKPKISSVTIIDSNNRVSANVYNSDKKFVAQSVYFARDLGNEPGNVIYPESFVERARKQLRGVSNVSIEVLKVPQMKRLNMGALLGVGRGSERPPRLMIVRYRAGIGKQTDFAFVGKGITFDTGGISLKKNQGMWYMKSDMSGAAAVIATIEALAKRGAQVNAVSIAALAENMPSGSAIRPGDVLKTMSEKTVEIMSTDAEGRLVLADAIHYAQQEFEPKMLIDVATLTGSAKRALGYDYAALFTRDEGIRQTLLDAGEKSGESVWPLPLNQNHYKQLKSLIADMKNTSDKPPGASTGAAFIGHFVAPDQAWAHLDIAGVDWLDEATPTVPVGHAGWGVRLLDQLVRTFSQQR